ncbi:MAG TPA: hypothetical protein VKO83_01335, partial [Steroidobacteraceae bacterium]|nr:hypothetical protein [Steroidobacteraceae bacterium]
AQASPLDASPAVAVVADESMMMLDGMPCHHDTAPASSQQDAHKHAGGCCDAGSCHCAAVCGLASAIVRIAPQPGVVSSPFAYLSAPAQSRPPDLRPPIR